VSHLKKVFALDRSKLDVRRAVLLLGELIVMLVVTWKLDMGPYFYSLAFGALFVGLIDPGGSFADRVKKLSAFAIAGAVLTAAAYAIGGEAWYWMALAIFVVTLVSSLALKYGIHRFVAAMLLNVWFLIVLSLPAGFALAGEQSSLWWQAVAWLAGAGFWLAIALVGWLLHGRTDRPAWVSEIPGDTSRHALTRPVIAFAVIRAVAMGVTVGIAFGLDLPNGIWLPIATFVAMKPSLKQATLVASQRVAGALIGALVAAALLVTVDARPTLVVITLLALTTAAAIRTVNYALYMAALSTGVLIALELPHFTGLSAEGQRVLWTLAGCAVAVVLMRASARQERQGAGREEVRPRKGGALPAELAAHEGDEYSA